MRGLLVSPNTEPMNMPVIPLGLGCAAELEEWLPETAAARVRHRPDRLM